MKNPPPTVRVFLRVSTPAHRCRRLRARLRTRVELVEGDAELAQAREELRLDPAVDGVVDPLVRRRLDVTVRLADADDLRDLPSKPGQSVVWLQCGLK